MIHYLYGSDLASMPEMAADMFRDRATQFRDRMGWDVSVDDLGWETDDYDAMDPLYVIAEDETGGHAGSMRFLPTTGPTMLADVFPHLTGGSPLRSPTVWECTRFCLSPGADGRTARLLLLAASGLGLGMGLSHSIGVFDAPMVRVYRRLGWEPEVLGSDGGISAGLWTFSTRTHARLCETLDLDPCVPRGWFDAAFGDLPLRARA